MWNRDGRPHIQKRQLNIRNQTVLKGSEDAIYNTTEDIFRKTEDQLSDVMSPDTCLLTLRPTCRLHRRFPLIMRTISKNSFVDFVGVKSHQDLSKSQYDEIDETVGLFSDCATIVINS